MLLKETIEALAGLVWPPTCAACGERLVDTPPYPESAAFCPGCRETLVPVSSPRCPACGLPFESSGDDHLCGRCLALPPPFRAAHIPLQYGGALKAAVSRLKYRSAPWLQRPLGNLLARAIPSTVEANIVVPVPLHPRRLSRRGFNQSALIASVVARSLGRPLVTGSLRRVVDTPPQARHGRDERLEALVGAFAVPRPGPVEGRAVLLVDDVVTTTATVRSASRALAAAGALRIDIAALARAV